jgi:hypothetical protein
MSTSKINKSSISTAALIAAIIVGGMQSAWSAQPREDAQAQARAFLSGRSANQTTGATTGAQAGTPVSRSPGLDAQSLARALLAGAPEFHTQADRLFPAVSPPGMLASSPTAEQTKSDVQAMARQIIIGNRS